MFRRFQQVTPGEAAGSKALLQRVQQRQGVVKILTAHALMPVPAQLLAGRIKPSSSGDGAVAGAPI